MEVVCIKKVNFAVDLHDGIRVVCLPEMRVQLAGTVELHVAMATIK